MQKHLKPNSDASEHRERDEGNNRRNVNLLCRRRLRASRRSSRRRRRQRVDDRIRRDGRRRRRTGDRRNRPSLSGEESGAGISHAVGGGRDDGGVREHRGKWRGLLEGRCDAVTADKHAGRELEVSFTRRELIRSVRSRHVVVATDQVEDVLAVVGASNGVVANFDAELIAADELRPIFALGDDAARRG